MIAALYVETGGVYWDLENVDPWDEERDARLYVGPWPVVAHPPCARWGQLANVNHARYGTPIGEDRGCFKAALTAVRKWGGVLEHPANSIAWRHFGLPKATRGAWTTSLADPLGASTEVSQVMYGHGAQKRTWLYAVGVDWRHLDWTEREGKYVLGAGINTGFCQGKRLPEYLAARTPEAFRDLLIGLARSVYTERQPRSVESFLTADDLAVTAEDAVFECVIDESAGIGVDSHPPSSPQGDTSRRKEDATP